MREKVKRFLNDFEKAFKNLKIAVEESVDDLDIDGSIKRFELCYELSWKLIKEYLADKGIVSHNNPKDTFKNAFANNLIDNEEPWLKMIEDRNCLVHTYTFEESRNIFERIKGSYVVSFNYLLETIKHGSEEDE